MDLTWSMYEAGQKVRFVPSAVCWPIEPHSFLFMSRQLKRWSHGFVQNVMLHWRGLLEVPYLRSAVAVSMWDATVASFIYLLMLPVLTIYFRAPWLLVGYLIDAPALLVPVLAGSLPRREGRRALISLPAFFVLRTVNAVFFMGAVWSELIMGKSFHKYEKGH
jgi:biofilm PGA synthesis N-glycosyltransferase PgaC